MLVSGGEQGAALAGLSLSLPAPRGFRIVSASPLTPSLECSGSGPLIFCSAPDLSSPAVVSLVLQLNLGTVTGETVFWNISASTDSPALSKTASSAFSIVPCPSASLGVSWSQRDNYLEPCDTVLAPNVTLSVSNFLPWTALGVVVSGPWPNGWDLVNASSGCSLFAEQRLYQCSIPSVPQGVSTVALWFETRQNPLGGSPVQEWAAQVQFPNCSDANCINSEANFQGQLTAQPCPLTGAVRGTSFGAFEVYRRTDEPCSFSRYSFVYRIFNFGALTLRSPRVLLPFDPFLVTVVAVNPSLNCTIENALVTCQSEDLPTGEVFQWEFQVAFEAGNFWNSTVSFPLTFESTTCFSGATSCPSGGGAAASTVISTWTVTVLRCPGLPACGYRNVDLAPPLGEMTVADVAALIDGQDECGMLVSSRVECDAFDFDCDAILSQLDVEEQLTWWNKTLPTTLQPTTTDAPTTEAPTTTGSGGEETTELATTAPQDATTQAATEPGTTTDVDATTGESLTTPASPPTTEAPTTTTEEPTTTEAATTETPTTAPPPVCASRLVFVGALDGFTFSPSSITLRLGDSVTFLWTQGQHSVRSALRPPQNCVAISRFNSGPRLAGDLWTLELNSTNGFVSETETVAFISDVGEDCITRSMFGYINVNGVCRRQ